VSASAQREPFEPFYLPAARGERFCIFHPTAGTPRGAILYLHPFAEEMNKSRRMAALQARMLAAHGFAVLQIDLFGCGDSSGEFDEARWEIWKQDVSLAVQWLRRRVSAPIRLWGLRLGALLALEFAAVSNEVFGGFLLWQPVVSGESFLTQFLRLRVATGMLTDDAAKTTTGALRKELDAGAVLEVAGYELAPELAHTIERLKLAELPPLGTPVHWLEVLAEAGRALSPASQRVADSWIENGVKLELRSVAGQPFWNTVEITECPELLAETTRVVVEAAR
jgi:exosortase A-associated hydrolase 2